MTQTLERDLAGALGRDFHGVTVAPNDHDYDELRQVLAGGPERRPALIARPEDAEGVARVIELARRSGLDLAVRGGGHSGARHSASDGGIVLDVRLLRGLDIDPAARTAWVGAGVTAGEYTTAVGTHGLATGFGDTASVGIPGLTLGGGLGPLSRSLGLSVDQLLAVELVNADGDLLQVDARTRPDLFWALRGGGGNFGVVTRLQFRLARVGAVLAGALTFPAEPDILAGLLREGRAAPEQLTLAVTALRLPPMPFVPAEMHGMPVIMAEVCVTGDPDEGVRLVDRLRSVGRVLDDTVQPEPYPKVLREPPGGGNFHPIFEMNNGFLDRIDGPAAAAALELLAAEGPLRMLEVRVLGGAIDRVPTDATAYPHRGKALLAHFSSAYTDESDRPDAVDWVRRMGAALGTDPALSYVNFLGATTPERVRAAFPDATWRRLVDVKRRYDPLNLFRANHNIEP